MTRQHWKTPVGILYLFFAYHHWIWIEETHTHTRSSSFTFSKPNIVSFTYLRSTKCLILCFRHTGSLVLPLTSLPFLFFQKYSKFLKLCRIWLLIIIGYSLISLYFFYSLIKFFTFAQILVDATVSWLLDLDPVFDCEVSLDADCLNEKLLFWFLTCWKFQTLCVGVLFVFYVFKLTMRLDEFSTAIEWIRWLCDGIIVMIVFFRLNRFFIYNLFLFRFITW